MNKETASVTMETYVRGANFEAIMDASEKVDRTISGSAYAIGATAEIKNYKGYLPLLQDSQIISLLTWLQIMSSTLMVRNTKRAL